MRSVNWYEVSGYTLTAAFIAAAFGENAIAQYLAIMSVAYGLLETLVRP